MEGPGAEGHWRNVASSLESRERKCSSETHPQGTWRSSPGLPAWKCPPLNRGGACCQELKSQTLGGEVGRSWTLGHVCMGRQGTEEAFPTGGGGMCVQEFWGRMADLVGEGNWRWVLRRLEVE